jgi:hypothetical protein
MSSSNTGKIGWSGRAFAGAVFIASLLFLFRFADLDGYEGDDLNSILPMAHLDEAKAGMLLIYRYAWQPLSYELGSWIWKFFGTPTAVFKMAPVAGSVAIALVALCAWREAQGSAALRMLSVLLALFSVPELFYSSLYYNSTIIGLPMAAAALLLLLSRSGAFSAGVAGILAGLAIMCRLDFILITPLLALAAWPRGKTIKRAIIFGAALVATLGLAIATGFLDLPEIIRIQAASGAEISEKASMPGWNLRTKLFVAAVSLAPLGWLLLVVSVSVQMLLALRQSSLRPLLWLLAALPACYPLMNILSPKYALPLAPFLVVLFSRSLSQSASIFPRQKKRLLGIAAAIGLAPLIISGSPRPLTIGFGEIPAVPVGTHDGLRAFGGYIPQMMAVQRTESWATEKAEAHRIVDQWRNSPSGDTLLVGGENIFDRGGVGWRHVQLILETHGIHGVLGGPHRLIFSDGQRRFILATALPASIPSGTYLIDRRSKADEP